MAKWNIFIPELDLSFTRGSYPNPTTGKSGDPLRKLTARSTPIKKAFQAVMGFDYVPAVGDRLEGRTVAGDLIVIESNRLDGSTFAGNIAAKIFGSKIARRHKDKNNLKLVNCILSRR